MADSHFHELPEFLRFNKYGGVLTKDDRDSVAKIKGVCSTCGRATHKVTPFRSIPLENDGVQGGICLKCHPDQRKAASVVDDPPSVEDSGKAAEELASVVSRSKIRRQLRAIAIPHRSKVTESPSRHDRKTKPNEKVPDLHALIISKKIARQLRSRYATNSNDRNITEHDEQQPHVLQSLRDAFHTATRPGRTKRDEPDSLHAHFPPVDRMNKSDRPQDSHGRSSLLDMHTNFHSAPDHIPQTSLSDYSTDAWDVVKEMRSHPNDVELLTRKCHELRDMGTNQAGSLYEVIEVMQRFPKENSLQIACIGALWSLGADGGDDERTEIIDAGGVKLILEAMKNSIQDLTLLSWGMGALNNLGQGMEGRACLMEEGVVANVENILKMLYNAKDGTNVLYWVFMCLITLVSDSSVIDFKDMEEDLAASERSRDAVVNTDIIPLVLHAICSVPIDGITLELALEVLSHFDVENHINDERVFSMEACEKAIQIKPHACFPTLHHLACAIVLLKMDPSDHEECRMATKFVSIALEELTYHGQQHYSSTDSGSSPSSIVYMPPRSLYDTKVHEVMVSTISHLLCFGNMILGTAESEIALKICCAILEHDKSSVFLQGSCCWIIWSLFCHGPTSIKSTSLALKAADAIQLVMPSIEHSPTLLTVSIAVLSEVAMLNDLEADPLVEIIAHLVSKYSNMEMLRREACQLLFYLCKTKADATHIVNAGGLDAVKKPLGNSIKKCRITVHLMIKLWVTGEDVLSNEDLDAMINASVQLKNVSLLAAKSWIGFLTESITPDREDFAQRSPMAINSIKEIMKAFPKNINLQRYACLALTDMAALIQQAKLALDISACIPPVLDAQKEHGVQIHKECCNAIWALMGVQCKLGSALMREVVYFAIEVTEIHVVSREFKCSGYIVSAGIAIFADIFNDAVSAVKILGEYLVDIVVDVLNKCFYSYLDRQEDNPSIFEFGFCTLHRLCNDDLCRDIIVSHGGIVAVVDGMMTNLRNASIQEYGCSIIWRLAGNDLTMKLNIVEADGVDVIMNAMITHGENASVLLEAFQALSCLSVDKSSRNFIAQQGGVMLIVNSMSTLAESGVVQETGLTALRNLASDVDGNILDASNMFSVVNVSLDCHLKDASIQRKGLALLYKLSMRSEGIRSRLLSSGCLKNVTKALKVHTSCSGVVSSALGIMFNLSETEACMQVMLDEKVIHTIIHSMMLNVRNLKVAIVCCKILRVICQKSTTSIGVGGVEAIVLTMMFHHSSEYIQDTGCCILACSSSHSFISNDGIFDADFFDLSCKLLEVILSAMSGFPRSPQLQKNSTIALKNMSEFDVNIAILNTELSRLEEILTQATTRFPECQNACKQVLGALS
eukprot:CAMPEP_0172326192 /NCGR_PEP_ID=MMETSP1058-20130122/55822_1 /TAXON_ID=83371 /ORGANISM="Detonula confervacea, Strain CCMP 353" /LENGTH=1360 /DNA_ID=CAMNT_0013042915 /DNA_START=289 /DNA_END=4368 /DNA_ORIENTATION=+